MNREMTMQNHILCVCALAGSLWSGAGSSVAQPAPPEPSQAAKARAEQFQAKLDAAAHQVDGDARLKGLSQSQRKDLVEFVTGNMVFALLHELGHAHVQEMGLPVLGREEDAADSYAITDLIKLATDASHNLLIQAAKGWFLSDARNQKEGVATAFYDEHELDRQRGYRIICMMVGADPDQFTDLANEVKMPEERQENCAGDYSNASWSWEMVLKPHLRGADQPKQKVSITYGPAGDYAVIAQALRTTGIFETLANYAANHFVWRHPIRLEVKACGEPDLHWELGTHKILVCYEMAQDFADLYRAYGLTYVLAPEEKSRKAKKK
jgi:Putative metallopeptidase